MCEHNVMSMFSGVNLATPLRYCDQLVKKQILNFSPHEEKVKPQRRKNNDKTAIFKNQFSVTDSANPYIKRFALNKAVFAEQTTFLNAKIFIYGLVGFLSLTVSTQVFLCQQYF